MEKTKFPLMTLKKSRSMNSDMNSPLHQKPISLVEPKLDPIKIRKVRLESELGDFSELVGRKIAATERSVDLYYDAASKFKGPPKDVETTTHSCLEDYEKARVERFQAMEVLLRGRLEKPEAS